MLIHIIYWSFGSRNLFLELEQQQKVEYKTKYLFIQDN